MLRCYTCTNFIPRHVGSIKQLRLTAFIMISMVRCVKIGISFDAVASEVSLYDSLRSHILYKMKRNTQRSEYYERILRANYRKFEVRVKNLGSGKFESGKMLHECVLLRLSLCRTPLSPITRIASRSCKYFCKSLHGGKSIQVDWKCRYSIEAVL